MTAEGPGLFHPEQVSNTAPKLWALRPEGGFSSWNPSATSVPAEGTIAPGRSP